MISCRWANDPPVPPVPHARVDFRIRLDLLLTGASGAAGSTLPHIRSHTQRQIHRITPNHLSDVPCPLPRRIGPRRSRRRDPSPRQGPPASPPSPLTQPPRNPSTRRSQPLLR